MAVSRNIVEDRTVPGTSMGPAGRGSVSFRMDRPQTFEKLQNMLRDGRGMPAPMPMPDRRFDFRRDMPPPVPMPSPMPPPGMGPFRPMPFPRMERRRGREPVPGIGGQFNKEGRGIMESVAVDPSDYRTILKLIDAGLDPNDYVQQASMAYDDDDYGPFIPPSVLEMDQFGIDYGPQDEYLFDKERGFENRIFGMDPNYMNRGGIASLLE